MAARLYALGSNSSGQLGIGHHQDVDVPQQCQFVAAPKPYNRITNNDASSDRTYSIKGYGLNSNIRKVVAGGNHTLVLCDDGAVYAAGSREALGQVLDLGSQYAELDGLNSQDLAPYFRRVMWWEDSELLCTFTDVSATWSASFFVVAPQIQNGYVIRVGRIYVCGKGDKGELGLGKDVRETTEPKRVAIFGSKDYPPYMGIDPEEVPLIPGILAGIWSSVACTMTCLTDEVHVFGWGSCRKGQLGDSARGDKVVWKPRKVTNEDMRQGVDFDRVFMAAVGRDLVLLQGTHGKSENRLKKWKLLGGNSFVKSDGDDLRNFLTELTVPVPQGQMVWLKTTSFASWSNIYVLESRTQKVKALGRNDHGQLPPEDLPKLQTMAAGSEHCVGLTTDGRVVTWGWGEHGNCGRTSDDTGEGCTVLNLPIVGAERVSGVGAGCATTFIWTAET
jgi:protein ATS1